MDRSKSLVTRGALERVLARAAELQANSGDDSEPTEALTEEQIVELGKEVGLSPENIRQALAEEQIRLTPLEGDTGWSIARSLIGPARVTAQRTVRGSPERILSTLDRWMQREEWLRVVRQRSDRIVWEPRPGFLANLRRIIGGRDYALTRANDIGATVVAVGKERSLVSLEADFSVLRRAMASQTVAGTVFGSAVSGVLVVLGVMGAVAVVPAVVVTGLSYAGSRRAQQHTVQRGLLALEQILDRLERGDAEPPSLLRLIEAAIPPVQR
jgi:hypothetical protein